MVVRTCSLVAVAATVLAGCASLPTPRSEAIHYALTTDASLRELASQCQSLSPQLESKATQTQRDWWRRNGAAVSAADYGLLQLNWDQQTAPIEDQRAYLSMQVIEMVQSDASEQVTDWLDDRPERNCERELTAFQDGERDLSRNSDHFETLVTLQNDEKQQMADVDQARVINARYRRFGRSLFVVEQKLQAQGCNQPQVSILRNEWPLEVYDAVCSDSSYVLMQCEWGRCDTLR
ncbi:hypothetical protein [Saccharospirillum alexandrii]|uniref:hypothetical protein n=1 Tax=Saccharospirillum alexandrii TaxID=2448477 RepID=UPI0037360620